MGGEGDKAEASEVAVSPRGGIELAELAEWRAGQLLGEVGKGEIRCVVVIREIGHGAESG